jgi:hypothetical protein
MILLDVLDASDEDALTLVTVGPFSTVAADHLGVVADGQVIATHDGVNPGMWIKGAPSEHQHGDRGLVESPYFRFRSVPDEDAISRDRIVDALRAGHLNDSAADQVEFVSDLVGWSAEDDEGLSAEYRATFSPEAWVNHQAIPVDPEGETEWDCTAFALEHPDYLAQLEDDLDDPDGTEDDYDVFKADPAAPEWAREWQGPFTIRIRRVEDE